MSKRFVTLDAMRGVAALAVVLSHAKHKFGGHSLPHTELAVDFFFALSGFVLAHAYDRRFEKGLSALDFMRQRALRLYPLFGLGLLIGAVAGLVAGDPTPQIANIFMLPAGPGELLFPGDDPAWSLFFEFWVANLVWALFWRRLHGRTLAALLAVSGVAMVAIAFGSRSYDLGWRWDQLGVGSARVTFSFFMGVWLARRHHANPPRSTLHPMASLALLVAVLGIKTPAAFAAPYLATAVLVSIPLLIRHSAALVEAKPSPLAALGEISYPAYAVHWGPLVLVSYLFGHAQLGTPATLAYVAAAATGAYLLDHLYDAPLRRWLSSLQARSQLTART